MNGDNDDIIDNDKLDDDGNPEDLEDIDTDNIGDLSVELNIEELTAKLAASDSEDVHHRAEIRRRLEELNELRQQELDSTYNLKFDDDD